MQQFEVVFYEKTDGTKPAREFIKSLDDKLRAKTYRNLRMLEKYGTDLREPYSKPLGDGIFELRTKFGSDITRVLYFFFVGKKAVITNGFIKKTNKTPASEIELAKSYRVDFWEREGNKNDDAN